MRGSIDYRAVFRAFPLPCALLTRDMIVVAANDAMFTLLDVKPQQLVDQSLFDCLQGMDPADMQPFRDALFAPLFHGKRESLVLRPGWPASADQPEGVRWRAVCVPMLGVTGEPEALLFCLAPPGYAALPAQGEVVDGQRAPDSLSRPGIFYAPAGLALRPGAEAGETSGSEDSILIVSTEPARREAAAEALRGAGYAVFEVDSAEAASRCFAASPDLGLVFLDMPEDATPLAREAFDTIDDVEVLQATSTGTGLRTALGAVNLSRPYNAAQLLSQVRHLLRNRGQRLLFREATGQASAAPAREPSAGPAQAHGAGAPLRILLVEDSVETRDAARDLLELLGHEVTAVESAESALDLLSSGMQVDVVCTDVSLPGMTGTALAMAVRQDDPDVGIVFASGFGDMAIDAESLRAVVLPKPYTLESLEAALRSARSR